MIYHLIPILKDSVKPNPNAGKDYIDIPGRAEADFDSMGRFTGYHYPIQRLYALSEEPEFLFKYDLETKVECECCKEIFPVKNLTSDYDDEYEYRENCCPNCNYENCCKLIYEEAPLLDNYAILIKDGKKYKMEAMQSES